MGHNINGFIASLAPLRAAASSLPGAKVVPLRQGLGFLPVTDDVAPGEEPAAACGMYGLTQRLEEWAEQQSRRFPIVYIWTDYFGGAGSQDAVAWTGCKELFTSGGSINAAVRLLGVVRDDSDEFDALGLGHYRGNGDWLKHDGVRG